jgi:hypothetical protein
MSIISEITLTDFEEILVLEVPCIRSCMREFDFTSQLSYKQLYMELTEAVMF